MAVTANQLIKRQDGLKGNAPVEEAVHLYQGTLAFFNSAGYLVDIVAGGANPFAGLMIDDVDNSAGADGALNGEFWASGDFPLVGTGFTQATVGLDIYASDNYTVGTSSSGTSYIGKCVGYVSSTVIIVRILDASPASPLASTATGTTGATFTVDSDVGKPRMQLGSQTGGTGDFVAKLLPPTTLTADHTFTLIGDADATLVNVATAQTLSNKTFTAPVLGVATGTSLAVTAGITSSGATGAGIGYATGAGGAVSQATDRTTGVTLDKLTGAITTQATSLAAQTSVAFTVTNSTVAIGDVIVLSIRSGPTGTKTIATVTTVAAGSFQINLFNTDASVADTGAAIINFAVIKAVSA